jgi:hypothetical protein
MAHEISLTPGQALYVIQRLLAERRVSIADIDRYLSQLSQEIRDIEARLEKLWAASPKLEIETGARSPARRPYRARRSTIRPPRKTRVPGAPLAALAPVPATLTKARKNRRPSSPAVRAKLKVQGRYVGYIRQVAAAKRPVFQRLAKHQGFEAAITALRAHLKK